LFWPIWAFLWHNQLSPPRIGQIEHESARFGQFEHFFGLTNTHRPKIDQNEHLRARFGQFGLFFGLTNPHHLELAKLSTQVLILANLGFPFLPTSTTSKLTKMSASTRFGQFEPFYLILDGPSHFICIFLHFLNKFYKQ